MNKTQEIVAEEVIDHLKRQNGSTALYSDELNQLFPKVKTQKIRQIVIGALKERDLVKDFPAGVIVLTEKGWDFKSFSDLRQKKLLRRLRKNISFILNVFFVLVTITLSILNFTISGKNKELTEKLLILEGEFDRLDAQLEYLQKYQDRISSLDTIK